MSSTSSKTVLINVLLTIITAALLVGFAYAVPSGSIKEEARKSYVDEAPEEDDEYAFLFD